MVTRDRVIRFVVGMIAGSVITTVVTASLRSGTPVVVQSAGAAVGAGDINPGRAAEGAGMPHQGRVAEGAGTHP